MAGNITLLSDKLYSPGPSMLNSDGANKSSKHTEASTKTNEKDRVTLSGEAKKIDSEYKNDKQGIETSYQRKKRNLQVQYNRELQALEADYKRDKLVAEIA